MAGGKKDKKDFRNSPFKQLKGLSVSPGPQKDSPGKPRSGDAGNAPPLGSGPKNGDDLFAREMELLGVKPKDSGPSEKAAAADPDERAPSVNGAGESDRDLFLSSLGEMDAVFRDELPEEPAEAASPRRMKQVRRGTLVPEATLDLHGLTREEARNRARHFLDNAVFHGLKTVLIVTGRGKGSGGEPVLRAEMERYLGGDARAWVAEWGRAPKQYGGEGALVVFLKGR